MSKVKESMIFLFIIIFIFVLTEKVIAEDNMALTVYTGQMTDDDFVETLTGQASSVDAYVLVGALAWTFYRAYEDALSFELEGQVGKWLGDQNHFEFNLPVVIRWSSFPWDHHVDTSFAYGLGLSYATSRPTAEIEIEGSTQKWLAYWFGEMAFGPPQSRWAGVLRIHHRSGSFGLVGDRHEGGSNTLAIGVKYGF